MKYVFLLLLLFSAAFAQDEGLYPDPPPADAAFVRIIQAIPNAESLDIDFGDQDFPALSYAELSDYYIVLQGEYPLKLSQEQMIEVSAGAYYSLVIQGDEDGQKALLIEDPMNDNRAKALLTLYNLSDLESIDMKTADDKEIEIILGVAPGTVASRAVNGIKVSLGAFAAGEKLGSVDDMQLERGAVYSMILLGAQDSSTLVWKLTETVLENE
ncbi:MAG: alginate O-acetyltransferase AlgF [Deinococcales bacterium]